MKTKLFSLFVALFATTALWAYDFKYGDLYYDITSNSDKTVMVTNQVYGNKNYEGLISANIPSSVTYSGITYSVTSIGDDAFLFCTSLTSITIPNSVTEIGWSAFSGCTGLTSVTIGDGVTSIGQYAFAGCTGLISITIPENVMHISGGAFRDTGIKFVTWNAKSCEYILTEFSPGVFEGSPITSFVFGENVQQIPENLLKKVSCITSITIPENVTDIGSYAFKETGINSVVWNAKSCKDIIIDDWHSPIFDDVLTTLVFSDFVQRIPANLLYQSGSKITSIVIPNSVLSIGENAFFGCSELSSLVMGNGVTSIEQNAFAHCTKLTSVAIPNSVLSLSGFNGCTGLTSITIPNGVVNIEEYAFSHCTNLKFVSIPNSVTSIRDNAFQGCTGLSSITIPDNVGYLSGFNECTSLRSITIPKSVTLIGNKAFEKCTGLTTITLPDKVTDIGENAFSGCTGLTAMTIPNRVTNIGDKAFDGCSNLHYIKVMAQKPPTCNDLGIDTCYVPCGTKDAYEAVKWGGMSTFYEGAYRVSILPNDINMGDKIVGEWMCTEDSITATPKHGYQFVRWSDGNTDNPRAVSLTCDTTFIAEFAQAYSGKCGDDLYWRYEDNTLFITGTGDMYDYSSHSPWSLFTKKIQSIVFDKGVTSIGNSAFQNGTSLRQVSFGDSLHIVGEHAFAFCSSLSSVCLPNALTVIENMAFYGCTSLTDVTFGTSLQKIRNYAFGGCNHLTNIELPNNLSSVGQGAFYGCTALGKVVLGKGLTSIEKSAFEKCNKLYDIYCYAIEPPAANTNSFSNYNVYLHVPCENLRNYQLDVLFGSFKYIECIGSDNVDSDGTIVVTPGNNEVEITWPSDGNADTYSILITKDGEEVCTLVFNSNGQLMRIAFAAPARNGAERHAPAAVLTQNGYRFTVTGLNSGTKYAYAIDVKDKAGTSINTYNGTFTTTVNGVPTDVEDVTTDTSLESDTPRKVFRDGQVLILRNGKTYTLTGVEVE